MEYNYFVDITSWFFIAATIGTIIKIITDSFLEWFNSQKGNLNKKLKESYKIHPLMKKFFSFNKIKKIENYNDTINNFNNLQSSISTSIVTFLVIVGITPFMLHTLIGLFPTLHITWCYIIITFFTMLVKTIAFMPFSYYATFNIEEKFGFNRSSEQTFYKDIKKGFIFSFVFTSVIISLLNYIFINFGPFTIKDVCYLVIGFMISGLIFEYLYMTVFIKIFNKLTPLKNKKLLKKIKSLLKKYGYNPNMVYQMDASKRTTKANAFIGGFGKSKKIVLFDTLLKNYTDDEIIAILGHELAHGKLHHLPILRSLSFVSTFLTTFFAVLLMYNVDLYHTFGYNWITEENVLQYSLIGFTLAETFISSFTWIIKPIFSYISRKCEYAADRFSIKFTRKKTAMISSLIKLSSENCSDLFPNEYYEAWNYSHPSLINRINAIKEINLKNKENDNEKENI